MTERPGGLKPLCVIAIILGSMGLVGAVFGVVSLAAQPRLAAPVQNPKLAEVNAEFERRFQELNRELMPRSVALLPFSFAASALLLAGGIRGLSCRGRGLLSAAFGGSLVIDLVAALVGVLMQLRVMDIMDWYFKEVAGAGHSPPGVGMRGVMLLPMIVFAGGWFLAKSSYYVWGLVYLRKPAVRAAFGPTPSDTPHSASATDVGQLQ